MEVLQPLHIVNILGFYYFLCKDREFYNILDDNIKYYERI